MRKYLIDTSSILSLFRYYAHFDTNGELESYLKFLLKSDRLIILQKVYYEYKNLKKRLEKEEATKIYASITESGQKRKEDIVITKKIHNKLENNWVRKPQVSRLLKNEYRAQLDEWIHSADAQLIAHAIEDHNNIIVTEETETEADNDRKIVTKIPRICKIEKLTCYSLPQMLVEEKIKFAFAPPQA